MGMTDRSFRALTSAGNTVSFVSFGSHSARNCLLELRMNRIRCLFVETTCFFIAVQKTRGTHRFLKRYCAGETDLSAAKSIRRCS